MKSGRNLWASIKATLLALGTGVQVKQESRYTDVKYDHKVKQSIEDVIRILDSAPVQPDVIPNTNIVQLTNRMPIAHLAIERGLKALTLKFGKEWETTHSLIKLYRALRSCDEDSANFLSKAFDDAVGFYNFNVNVKGSGYFRSIDRYLSKVGGENAFHALRYWAIGQTSRGENPIPYISPLIHRELLCALSCLFVTKHRETVSERVEREVTHAMYQRRHIYYVAGDTSQESSVYQYINWLFKEHTSRQSALKEAVDCDLASKSNDEFFNQTLREAHNDLEQSKDPAIQYFMSTLRYVRRGSEPRNPDATPKVKWNDNKNGAIVLTPAGTLLGTIRKQPDGAWEITSLEDSRQEWVVTEALADAKHYLVNRLTRQVEITVNGNQKQMRIVGEPFSSESAEWTPDTEAAIAEISGTKTFELNFWDCAHDLQPGGKSR